MKQKIAQGMRPTRKTHAACRPDWLETRMDIACQAWHFLVLQKYSSTIAPMKQTHLRIKPNINPNLKPKETP